MAPAPATLSYSSLTRYAACPYRFHLERHLGLPEVEPPAHLREAVAPEDGLDPRVRGSLVHELLEGLEHGAPAPGEEAVRAIAATYEVELTPEDVADLLGMVAAFAASELSARLGAAPAVHREHWFAFPLMADGPLVNGVVDVLAEEADGTALVVDYKSDRVGDADLEALVEASYGVQRRIYGLACLRAGAPAVEVVHIFLERAAEPVVTATARTTPRRSSATCASARPACSPASFPSRRPAPRRCAPPAPAAPASVRTRRTSRTGPSRRPWAPISPAIGVRSCELPFHLEARERRMRPTKRWRTVRPDGPGNIFRGKARRKERP